MIKILVFSTNPSDKSRLLLEREIRAINERIRLAEYRDSFEVEQCFGTRIDDLPRCLMHYKPDIVHFSGYVGEASQITLADDSGTERRVPTRALARLFLLLRDNIRCVVLNTNCSAGQARKIARHIDCVIGMSRAITDKAAISFAGSFYQALAFGRSVKTAFELGCEQIDLNGWEEKDVPKLWSSADPNHITFVVSETHSPVEKSSLNAPAERRPRKVRAFSPARVESKPIDPRQLTSGLRGERNFPKRHVRLSHVALILVILLLGSSAVWLAHSNSKYADWSSVAGNGLNESKARTELGVQQSQDSETNQLEPVLLQAANDLRMGRYDEVITNCNAILKNNPNQPRAMLLLGEAHYQTNNCEFMPLLARAISLGETATLPITHYHQERQGDSGFCSAYLSVSKDAIQFHSNDVSSEDFIVPLSRIHVLSNETYGEGILRLEIRKPRGNQDVIAVYHVYPPPAVLRQSETAPKVYGETEGCRTPTGTLFELLQGIKSSPTSIRVSVSPGIVTRAQGFSPQLIRLLVGLRPGFGRLSLTY